MAKLTARAAIAKVLGDAKGKAVKVPEIVAKAVPLTNLGGKTPGQTIYSVLYSEGKKTGAARQFIQAGKGEFKLNPNFKATVRGTSGAKSKSAAKTSSARKTTASRKTAAARKTGAKTTGRRSGRSSSKAVASA